MKNHSQQNITIVKNFYEAASNGDFGPVSAALDPNVEWIEPTVPGLWFSGPHRGANAVWKEVLEPTAGKIDNFRLRMKRLYAVGDHVIAIGYFHGRVKATGKELDAATAHVCTLRNGKIVRFEAYDDSASWQDALGLVRPELQRMAA